MSLSVASGVDFFTGMTAAEVSFDGVGLALLFSAGDDFGEADGEALGFGEGEAVFSVVTETLVSEGDAVGFSDAVASGEAAGEGLDSSWARAKGTAAKTRAVRTSIIVFICVFLFFESGRTPYWGARGPVKPFDQGKQRHPISSSGLARALILLTQGVIFGASFPDMHVSAFRTLTSSFAVLLIVRTTSLAPDPQTQPRLAPPPTSFTIEARTPAAVRDSLLPLTT